MTQEEIKRLQEMRDEAHKLAMDKFRKNAKPINDQLEEAIKLANDAFDDYLRPVWNIYKEECGLADLQMTTIIAKGELK